MTAAAPAAPAPAVLPSPGRERWQPQRCGLLNLFKYDYEEFRFADGRLLLRGNNGTGKSRVLALTLPFLLDGELSPRRVEPDGDSNKRMAWNLLMGRHTDRRGYTWLELGRRDPVEGERFLTLGCGLNAHEGRPVETWFFVTPKRIGRDLYLQSRSGQALGRKALEEALGDAGELFATAQDYRRAVDEALYGLGTRYRPLVDLLIQLRQPQLSRSLDDGKLSQALSEALAPLPEAIVDDLAEAFRGLEDDRLALEGYEAAGAAVERFMADYGRYAAIAARRAAAEVRSTHHACEDAGRRLAAARREQEEAEAAAAALAGELERLEGEERTAEARIDALRASPAMKSAEDLKGARSLARERAGRVEQVERDHTRAADQAESARRRAAAAGERAAAAADALRSARDDSEQAARRAGLERVHAVHFAPERLLDAEPDPAAVEPGLAAFAGAVRRRREGAELIGERNAALAEAERALAAAKRKQDDLEAEQDAALARQQEAHDALAEAAAELGAAARAWLAGLVELAVPEPEGLLEELEAWEAEVREREAAPLAPAVQSAHGRAAAALEAEVAERRHELRVADAELSSLRDERAEVAAGRHAPPAPPPTRDPDARRARPGAPLWRVCDFAPAVEPAERAGLEAALEAGGLLDAWVTPDGALLADGDHDVVLVPGRSPRPPEGRALDRVLRPAVDRDDAQAAALSDEAVAAVLAHVGLGEGAGPVWVDASGRFQVGPLHGAWSKPAAEHVGEGAREAARRRRLEELAARIAEAEDRVADLAEAVEVLAARRRRLDAERDAAPDEAPVERARARLTGAERDAQRWRERVTAQEAVVLERRQAAVSARARRDEEARDLDLTDWVDALEELRSALGACQLAQRDLRHAVERAGTNRREARAAEETARAADEALAERTARLRDERHGAAEAAERLATLERTVGAEVAEVEAELAAAAAVRRDVRAALDRARGERLEAEGRRRGAGLEVTRVEERLEAEAGRREAAIGGLRRVATAGLLAVALASGAAAGDAGGPDDAPGGEAASPSDDEPGSWSTTRAVAVARDVERRLSGVASDEEAWRRSQNGIHGSFQELEHALLPRDYRPRCSLEDGLLVVAIPYQSRTCTPLELQALLVEEVAQRQRILDAREREVLERHLIGDVAVQLHERIRAGEALVQEMNAEIESRPTSTGMRLRFRWTPDPEGPPGLVEARRRLLQTGDAWTDADRDALTRFLKGRIDAARAEDDSRTWREHLLEALDYRRWHRFQVERCQDGKWLVLTRRTHGTGSGGEKAIALTIPQFAAAAAHYRSAHPHAPRLILLDEAFVGVDAEMRASCMGLLRAFDLDFVMTSEREWGCYATVPSVAICQLAARPGFDAVHVTRWVWNGRERVRDLGPVPSAAEPDSGREEPGDDDPEAPAGGPAAARDAGRQLGLLPAE